MKARHIIFPVIFFAVMSSCADAGKADEIKKADSPSLDSTMPAHVQDPSTAFPQPPVTGTLTDSSRTEDSAKKKDTTQVRGN